MNAGPATAALLAALLLLMLLVLVARRRLSGGGTQPERSSERHTADAGSAEREAVRLERALGRISGRPPAHEHGPPDPADDEAEERDADPAWLLSDPRPIWQTLQERSAPHDRDGQG